MEMRAYSQLLCAAILAALAYGRGHEDREIFREFDALPPSLLVYETTEIKESWNSRVIHVTDLDYGTGRVCDCTPPRESWSKWSICSARPGQCYEATQTRIRRCSYGCTRIQVRYCLHPDTCTGLWTPWIALNSSCTACGIPGKKTSIRFCESTKNEIGPFCSDSNGKGYQTKEEDCYQACIKASPASENLLSQSTSNKPQLMTGHSNLIIICLSVGAGVLLVALIFTLVVMGTSRRKKKRHRGMARDLSESNISAMSYLSGGESRASGRTTMYTQHKVGGRQRLISPSSVPSFTNMAGSVKVRGPMQHNDSIMLARKQIPGRRANKGSLRSIHKRERSKLDQKSTGSGSQDAFFIGSINFKGVDDVIEVKSVTERKNLPKRRATVSTADLKDVSKSSHYYRREDRKRLSDVIQEVTLGQEESIEGKFESFPDEREEFTGSSSDMDDDVIRKKNKKKRPSVEDIRKIFENHSKEKIESRSFSKNATDFPESGTSVGQNISRFEQVNEALKSGTLERRKKLYLKLTSSSEELRSGKKGEKNRQKSPTSSASSAEKTEIKESGNTVQNGKSVAGKAELKGTTELITDSVRKEGEERGKMDVTSTLPNLQFNNSGKKNKKSISTFHSNTTKPKKRTFLFSPQAFSSLQRSEDSPSKNEGSNNGYRMDFNALTSRAAKNKPENEYDNINGHAYAVPDGKNRSKSYQDPPTSQIVTPQPRSRLGSTDSDTYADVWDAKPNEKENEENNLYADVWEERKYSSMTSICKDDDDDYSEVYDAVNSPKNVAKARDFASRNARLGSPGTPPSSGQYSPQSARNNNHKSHRKLQGSHSVGNSPQSTMRAVPLSHRFSRESLDGSLGRISNLPPKTPPRPQSQHSVEKHILSSRKDQDNDPIYCII